MALSPFSAAGTDAIRLTPSVPWTISTTIREEMFEHIRELDTSFQSEVIREERWLGPSTNWTKVTLKSQVASSTARRMNSPSYLATVRRREAAKLLKLVYGLAKHVTREDFVVCTHPVVDGVKTLLTKLQDAEMEGNSSEILRRLRDTFLDGGWNRYKEATARGLAERALQFLADAEEIGPRDANRFFDEMFAAGLRPVGLPLFGIEDEEIEDDGDEETEVVD
jgi:hypothetical protein